MSLLNPEQQSSLEATVVSWNSRKHCNPPKNHALDNTDILGTLRAWFSEPDSHAKIAPVGAKWEKAGDFHLQLPFVALKKACAEILMY